MKTVAQLTYDKFIINKVSEEMPPHNEKISSLYPMNGNTNNVLPAFSMLTDDAALLEGEESTYGSSSLSGRARSSIEFDSNMFSTNKFTVEATFIFPSLDEDINILSMLDSSSFEFFSFTVAKGSNQFLLKCSNTDTSICVPRKDDGIWGISGPGTVEANKQYDIKLYFCDGVLTFYVNGIFTYIAAIAADIAPERVLFCKNEDFDTKKLLVYKLDEDKVEDSGTLQCEELLDDEFSISFDFAPNATYNQVILSTDLITVTYDSNTLTVDDSGNSVMALGISDGQTYSVVISHGINGYISIYNRERCKKLAELSYSVATTSSSSNLYTLLRHNRKIALYNGTLSEEEAKNISINHLSLRDNMVGFKLNETGLYSEITTMVGERYQIPLTDRYSSNYSNFTHVNASMKSGKFRPEIVRTESSKYCRKYTEMSLEDGIPSWNSELHSDAYRPAYWSNGYVHSANAGAGMHAKWINEGKNPTDLCLKLTANSNRTIGSSVKLYRTELFESMSAEDTFTVSMLAKADMDCKLVISLSLSNDSSQAIKKSYIDIKKGDWKTYHVQMQCSEELITSAESYAHVELAKDDKQVSAWMQDFAISKGVVTEDANALLTSSECYSIDMVKDYAITASNTWHVLYQAKGMRDGFLDNIGGILYGIKNGSIVVIDGEETMLSTDSKDWMLVSIRNDAGATTITFYTKDGSYIKELNRSTSPSLSFAEEGCALYKFLTIIKNGVVDEEKIKNNFFTKMSYRQDNTLASNVIIEERVND